MTLKFITCIRPSGSLIEIANTKELRAYAKANGWKIKREQPKIGGEDGDGSASSEGDTPEDTGTGS